MNAKRSDTPDLVRASATVHAIDRYSAALFAPAAARPDLIAVAAFTGEIDHIVRSAQDVALGEIRLQWWRDGIASAIAGAKSGHPVLDAFAETATRCALPQSDVERFIDARADDLVGVAPADDEQFAEHVLVVDGTPLKLAAKVLGVEVVTLFDGPFEQVARACGLARIGRELPYFLSRGTSPLRVAKAHVAAGDVENWRLAIAQLGNEARRLLAAARSRNQNPRKDLLTALLPAALIEPYFFALQKKGNDPTRDLVEIVPLARLWHMTRAYVVGRL